MEWILINIIEAILLSWFISSLLDVHKNKLVYQVLLAVTSFSLITISNYINTYDIVLTSIVILCNIVISYIFVDNDLSEIIFVCCLESVFGIFVTLFAVVFNQIIQLNIVSIISKLLYFILGIILMKSINRYSLSFDRILYYILAAILFSLHFIMQQFIQIFLVLGIQIPELIISFIVMIGYVIGLFFILIYISQLYKEKESFEKLKQEKMNNEVLSRLYEDVKITKHDLKHNLGLLQHYLNQREYSDAIHLIETKINIVEKVPSLIQSHNNLINILINGKIIKAYSKNIKVQCDVTVKEEMSINEYDLNELLSNVLDNAIEYCSLNGLIEIQVLQDEHILSIGVSNSISEDFDKNLETKKDKKHHGFGLKSIQRITNQYHGVMKTKVENKQFYIMITLILK